MATPWILRGPRRLCLAVICPTDDPRRSRGPDPSRWLHSTAQVVHASGTSASARTARPTRARRRVDFRVRRRRLLEHRLTPGETVHEATCGSTESGRVDTHPCPATACDDDQENRRCKSCNDGFRNHWLNPGSWYEGYASSCVECSYDDMKDKDKLHNGCECVHYPHYCSRCAGRYHNGSRRRRGFRREMFRGGGSLRRRGRRDESPPLSPRQSAGYHTASSDQCCGKNVCHGWSLEKGIDGRVCGPSCQSKGESCEFISCCHGLSCVRRRHEARVDAAARVNGPSAR